MRLNLKGVEIEEAITVIQERGGSEAQFRVAKIATLGRAWLVLKNKTSWEEPRQLTEIVVSQDQVFLILGLQVSNHKCS